MVPLICNVGSLLCAQAPVPEAAVGFLKHALEVEQNQTFGNQYLCFHLHVPGASRGSSVLHGGVSVQAQSFPDNRGLLNSDFISLEARKAYCFLSTSIFIFKRRPCSAPRDVERGFLSMPWTDGVWIKPDIERSFVLKKHLNFCNICVRMLSHVALV